MTVMRSKSTLTLQIELSDQCPLNCIMCRKKWHENVNKTGNMPIELTRIIADFIAAFDGRVRVMLQWGGEPLMHPDVSGIIRDFRLAGADVALYTSGYGMNAQIMDALCVPAPGEAMVIFSLDASSESTYCAVKGIRDNRSDCLTEIEQAISRLQKMRNSALSSNGMQMPAIAAKMIIMAENCEEAIDFALKWKKRLEEPLLLSDPSEMRAGKDAVILCPLNRTVDSRTDNPFGIFGALFQRVSQMWCEPARPEAVTEDSSEAEAHTYIHSCRDLWDNLTIAASGHITTCCRDDNLERMLGHVNSGIWSAIHHPLRITTRNLLMAGLDDKCGLCDGCSQFKPLDVSTAAAWGEWSLCELIDHYGQEQVADRINYIVEAGNFADIVGTVKALRLLYQADFPSICDNPVKQAVMSAAARYISDNYLRNRDAHREGLDEINLLWPEAVQSAIRLGDS